MNNNYYTLPEDHEWIDHPVFSLVKECKDCGFSIWFYSGEWVISQYSIDKFGELENIPNTCEEAKMIEALR